MSDFTNHNHNAWLREEIEAIESINVTLNTLIFSQRRRVVAYLNDLLLDASENQ